MSLGIRLRKWSASSALKITSVFCGSKFHIRCACRLERCSPGISGVFGFDQPNPFVEIVRQRLLHEVAPSSRIAQKPYHGQVCQVGGNRDIAPESRRARANYFVARGKISHRCRSDRPARVGNCQTPSSLDDVQAGRTCALNVLVSLLRASNVWGEPPHNSRPFLQSPVSGTSLFFPAARES